MAQFQEQITKIRSQIEEIKILIEIKDLKKEIAEKESLMEKVRMYGLTLHQTIPDIILKGLYPFKVAEESATTTATTTDATTTSAETIAGEASSTEGVAAGSEATTTEIVTAGGGFGEGATPASAPDPEPEPPPAVCNPVASGVRTYTGTTKTNPKITQVRIDPLDVQKFAYQTVSVNIQDMNENSVTEVSGTAITDNNSFPFSLSLVSGTDINGTWQGSWLNLDTYCQIYMLKIIATSESGQSKVEIAFK